MKIIKLFRRHITIKSKEEIELEERLKEELRKQEETRKGPLQDYIRNNITHLSPEDFVPHYNKLDYMAITLYSTKTQADIHNFETDVVQKCLEDMAQQAIDNECNHVVGLKQLAYNDMASKATSGGFILLGGTGIGIARPYGTYSKYLALIGTGLIKKVIS
ncbi:hypothetical protein J4409_01010 [Candidatus Woesearchaeota archaeon]|nr:hypothetical protein [Candidatus Woesearchaeota archaeon]